ncbi:sensor histidine kinase [Paenibacillus sp. GCM10023252]|uniref:sensor histidine kinase n=1 Tax=Paenibacillus sp. GCM10023252 TaxID=3252649 RepID=UPI003621BF5A
MLQYKVFRRLLLMLAALLLPTTLLFTYANQTSKNVVKETLENSASKQVEYTIGRLEQTLRQLEQQTLVLTNDSSIRSYSNQWDDNGYLNHLLNRKPVEEKLELQSQAEPLFEEITVHFPRIEEVVSTVRTARYNYEELARKPKNQWYAEKKNDQLSFRLLLSNSPFFSTDWSNITTIVETAISSAYLNSVLEGLDQSGNGTSILVFGNGEIIANEDTTDHVQSRLIKQAKLTALTNDNSSRPLLSTVDIDGEEYLIQSMRVPSLEGTLISYIKTDDFLLPLRKVNGLVNGSLILLFLTGIIFAYLFYKHFRLPFAYLVRKIENLGAGDYAVRATVKTRTEFDFLFERFNDMAAKTQSLIENVYEEKVRTREAEYKYLQSQINPHFLYNCLFYIVSMANKSPEAVISMAKNLSHFYRYITHKAGAITTLEDEIRLIRSYLDVQSLRNRRLTYTIDIPPVMMELAMPSLLLQPIVENAIVHGIEGKQESGNVQITGTLQDSSYILYFDDDGLGLSDEEIVNLTERVQSKYQTTEEMSCGMRNVHHRIINQYGKSSGISFLRNEWGGLRVVLLIDLPKGDTI